MFAGESARELVSQSLNTERNMLNLQSDAHMRFDQLQWGIEAVTLNDGSVCVKNT